MFSDEWQRSLLPECDESCELMQFRRVSEGEFSNVENEERF